MGTATHRTGAPASSGGSPDRPAREFHLVVLAPTGYQGRRVVAEVHAALGGQGHRLAAAGRDAERVAAALAAVGASASFTVLGGCDAADAGTMPTLAGRTTVLLSCCGDFAATGPGLVAACVEAGTHYLDASLGCHMESVDRLWRQLRREHHATAAATGTLVINSLGFDTVIADFAVLDLSRRFTSPPPAAVAMESYLSLKASKGYVLRKSTWMQHTTEAPSRAAATTAAEGGESATSGSDTEGGERLLSYCPELKCWSVPGAASEAPLVMESQTLLREQAARQGLQPPCPSHITYAARLPLPSPVFAGLYLLKKGVTWLAGKAGSAWGGGGSWMASDTAVRLVTGLGLVTEDEARFEESGRAKSFRKTFVARGAAVGAVGAGSADEAEGPGRDEGASAAGDRATAPTAPVLGVAGHEAGQEVHMLTVSGPSPGYDVTPASLALAAAVLLEEGGRISGPGGFTTPAAALHGTSFWDQLQERCGLVVSVER